MLEEMKGEGVGRIIVAFPLHPFRHSQDVVYPSRLIDARRWRIPTMS